MKALVIKNYFTKSILRAYLEVICICEVCLIEDNYLQINNNPTKENIIPKNQSISSKRYFKSKI